MISRYEDNLIEKIFLVRKIKMPISNDLETLVLWLLYSLGIITNRDKKNIKVKILLKLMEIDEPINAETIAKLCKLNRTTALFHLQELVKRGLVEYKDYKFFISEKRFSEVVEKIRKQLNETLDIINGIAKIIDGTKEIDQNQEKIDNVKNK